MDKNCSKELKVSRLECVDRNGKRLIITPVGVYKEPKYGTRSR